MSATKHVSCFSTISLPNIFRSDKPTVRCTSGCTRKILTHASSRRVSVVVVRFEIKCVTYHQILAKVRSVLPDRQIRRTNYWLQKQLLVTKASFKLWDTNKIQDNNKSRGENVQNVKFFLVHPMKAYRDIRRTAPVILNSVLDAGELLNSRFGRFTPGNNRDN